LQGVQQDPVRLLVHPALQVAASVASHFVVEPADQWGDRQLSTDLHAGCG